MKFLVLVKVRREARITLESAEAHTRVILEQTEKGAKSQGAAIEGKYEYYKTRDTFDGTSRNLG